MMPPMQMGGRGDAGCGYDCPDQAGAFRRRQVDQADHPGVELARNTVRRVLRSGETAFSYERAVQPRPKLGAWTETLDRRLAANDRLSSRERLDLARIYEDLRAEGFEGGYDTVRRYAQARQRKRGTGSGNDNDSGPSVLANPGPPSGR